VSETPPNPVAAEDTLYATLGAVYAGLRRNGTGIIGSAAITAFHWAVTLLAAEAQAGPDGS
jgi:hypothetical protein